MEHIYRAAIKFKNELFMGTSHNSIIQQAEYERGLLLSIQEDAQEWFVTNTGRFVDRREAAKIAFKAKQIKEPLTILKSNNIKFQ